MSHGQPILIPHTIPVSHGQPPHTIPVSHGQPILVTTHYTCVSWATYINTIHYTCVSWATYWFHRQASMNKQNPMFVHPYDNWAGVDTSGVESVWVLIYMQCSWDAVVRHDMFNFSGEDSNLQRDNPLYESQEIRMEMFADVTDDEDDSKYTIYLSCTVVWPSRVARGWAGSLL